MNGVVGSEISELTASGYAVIVVVCSELTMQIYSEWCGLGSEISELTVVGSEITELTMYAAVNGVVGSEISELSSLVSNEWCGRFRNF